MINQSSHTIFTIARCLASILFVAYSFSTHAQQDKFRWRFGVGVGNQYIKDTPIGADSATGNNAIEVGTSYLSYSALVELSLSQDFGLKLYTLTQPDELKISNSGLLLSYYFDNDYLLSDHAFITPYVSVGIAFGTSQNSLSLPFGAGLKFRLSDRFNLNLDYTARTPTHNWDDADYSFGESLRAYASLSLHYNFGRKDDAYKAPVPYVSAYPQSRVTEVNTNTPLPTPDSIMALRPRPQSPPDTLVQNNIPTDSSLSFSTAPDSAGKARLLARFGNILEAPELMADSNLTQFGTTDTSTKQLVSKTQKDSTLSELEYAIRKQKLQNELSALQKASQDSSLNYLMQENQRLKDQLQANEKINALQQRVAQLEAGQSSMYQEPAPASQTEYSSDYTSEPGTTTTESDYTPSYNRSYNTGSGGGNNFGSNAAAAGTGALIGSTIGNSGQRKQNKQIDRLEAKIDSLQRQIAGMQTAPAAVVSTSGKVDTTKSDTATTDSSQVIVHEAAVQKTPDTNAVNNSASEVEQLKKQLADMSERIDSLIDYQKSTNREEAVSVAATLEKSKEETFFENSGKVQVFFETNSSELSERSRKKLDDMIKYAEAHPQTHFWVKGFTDKTGSARYNEILSKRRAAAVQQYLQKNGIDPQRLNIVSLGQDASLSSGDQQYGRRVEVVLY